MDVKTFFSEEKDKMCSFAAEKPINLLKKKKCYRTGTKSR